tara:strand:+ start:753 stop:1091 length:339 start_codon:yes stop_codon:yes gene_type:complete
MSRLIVDTIGGRNDNAPTQEDGLIVTGITTLASSGGITTTGGTLFVGAGASVGGRLEVSGITSVGNLVSSGIVTADSGSFSGSVTANSFSGDGSSLTGLPAGWNELDAALFN